MYNEIKPFVFDCVSCPTRCDGLSKNNYQFEQDAVFSEYYEQKIIDYINSKAVYTAIKSTATSYPDVQITNHEKQTVSYLEVKVQQRTFMAVKKILPNSGLVPSETVALNLSDLLRYFDLHQSKGLTVSIVWVLLNRPCVVKPNEIALYYQKLEVLNNIYTAEKENRRFRRASGEGDIIDGQHKGVTVNYHFSLKELIKWKIEIT